MAVLKLPNGYDRLSDSALLEKANFFHQQVSTRTTVFATPVPTMTVLKDVCDDFQAALSNAQGGDLVAISQKNIFRDDLIDKMHQLSNYVQLTANGNPHIVTEAGMSLPRPSSPKTLGSAMIVSSEYTGISGEVLLATKCPNGKSFMYQYSTDAELKEESWKSMPSNSRSKGKIVGLTPGTVYFFRVCVTGTNSQMTFSPVISKMAV
jgi:hypothetical protein